MSLLKTLQIENFRNLQFVSLEFHPHLNLFYGENGSGKSSLLEAIYTLAYGKSYRNHLKARVIRHGEDYFRLFSSFEKEAHVYRAGIEKSQKGDTLFRLNGESLASVAELAQLLPVQLINPNSYEIIEEGPAARRKYLDWGVFHVKHDFHDAWRSYSRCLKQRNLSLKLRYSKSVCQSWDHELIEHGEIMTQYRAEQLSQILPIFLLMLSQLGLPNTITLTFYQGWSQERTLQEAILQSFETDYNQGFTHVGPHRADLKILVDGIPSDDVLSRGQEKLIVSALQLAQAHIVRQETSNSVIYLLDDLPSELDAEKREHLYRLINKTDGQVFITATERSLFPDYIRKQANVFHVEQGSILNQDTELS